jgi:hypothetical protein
MRLVAVALSAALATADPAAGAPTLTAADAKYLDHLLAEFLFDPSGAERVRYERPDPGSDLAPFVREGWRVRGRVFTADGHAVAAPGKVTPIDFVAACRERYAVTPKADPADGDWLVLTDSDLAVAAWLHRLGHDHLAAKALAAARGGVADAAEEGKPPPDPKAGLRDALAREALAGLFDSFARRADADALAHGERLFRLYPDRVEQDKWFGQAKSVVAELRRRQAAGTFEKEPPKEVPAAVAADVGKKVAWLIAALDEADVRQIGGQLPPNLSDDWRVKALIEIGEPAVPALIDALEKDDRLTRTVVVHHGLSGTYRRVEPVRKAAVAAVMTILRFRIWESATPETAVRLRAYWAEYGRFPFDERVMKILGDPRTSSADRAEAAYHVAASKNPAAAAAILAAMDHELARLAVGAPQDVLRDTAWTEATYLGTLAGLGDRRIAATLAGRAKAATRLSTRREYALAAHRLGDPKPMEQLAAEFESGTLVIPDAGEPRPVYLTMGYPASEFERVVRTLTAMPGPATDRALFALADPKHRYHAAAARQIRDTRPTSDTFDTNFRHPYCLAILRVAFTDTTPTGWTYERVEEGVVCRHPDGSFRSHFVYPPSAFPEADALRKEVDQRACDDAVEKASELLVGAPHFHPLRKDADARRAALGAFIDRYGRSLRPVLPIETARLGVRSAYPRFIPDIRPLGRPATAADVAAGRAVFHLGGKGKVAGVALPAWVVLTADADDPHPPRGLAVQAEVGPDGAVTYGVIFRADVRVVPAAEVGRVEPRDAP